MPASPHSPSRNQPWRRPQPPRDDCGEDSRGGRREHSQKLRLEPRAIRWSKTGLREEGRLAGGGAGGSDVRGTPPDLNEAPAALHLEGHCRGRVTAGAGDAALVSSSHFTWELTESGCGQCPCESCPVCTSDCTTSRMSSYCCCASSTSRDTYGGGGSPPPRALWTTWGGRFPFGKK